MSVARSKVSQKSHKSSRKTSKTNLLGAAPNDIDTLSSEIDRIKLEDQHTPNEKNDSSVLQVIQLNCNQMKEAKIVIKNKESFRMVLPNYDNLTSKYVLKLVSKLGFNNSKLLQLYNDMPIMFRNQVNNYINIIKQNPKLNEKSYLLHAMSVTPIKYDFKTDNVCIRIRFNLNYNKIINNSKNKKKFIKSVENEIGYNIIRCGKQTMPSDIIQFDNFEQGSIWGRIKVAANVFWKFLCRASVWCRCLGCGAPPTLADSGDDEKKNHDNAHNTAETKQDLSNEQVSLVHGGTESRSSNHDDDDDMCNNYTINNTNNETVANNVSNNINNNNNNNDNGDDELALRIDDCVWVYDKMMGISGKGEIIGQKRKKWIIEFKYTDSTKQLQTEEIYVNQIVNSDNRYDVELIEPGRKCTQSEQDGSLNIEYSHERAVVSYSPNGFTTDV